MLAQDYDAIYTAKPTKWTDDYRNMYAFDILSQHTEAMPEKLLDIGCGNGHTLRYFSKRWKHTAYYGVDLSPVGIKIAYETVPNATLTACELTEYEPGVKFDVILVMGVMEHFEDLTRNLEKIKGLLAPGGAVYVEIPNNLDYAKSKEHGFRKEGIQTEWHLPRSLWERILLDKFKISRSWIGPQKHMEFIWILTHA